MSTASELFALVTSSFSFVQPYKEYASACSYCRRPFNKGRFALGAHWWSLDVIDYDALLDAGWLRSGSHCYLPSNDKACCPNIPIRLDAELFQPSRQHVRALRRMHEYLSGARPITLPEVNDDVLERCLTMAEGGMAREACELVCRERARGDPLADDIQDSDGERSDQDDKESTRDAVTEDTHLGAQKRQRTNARSDKSKLNRTALGISREGVTTSRIHNGCDDITAPLRRAALLDAIRPVVVAFLSSPPLMTLPSAAAAAQQIVAQLPDGVKTSILQRLSINAPTTVRGISVADRSAEKHGSDEVAGVIRERGERSQGKRRRAALDSLALNGGNEMLEHADGVCNAAFLLSSRAIVRSPSVEMPDNDAVVGESFRDALAEGISLCINAAAAADKAGGDSANTTIGYVRAIHSGKGYITLSLGTTWSPEPLLTQQSSMELPNASPAAANAVRTHQNSAQSRRKVLPPVPEGVSTTGLPVVNGVVVTCLSAAADPTLAPALKAHYRRIQEDREAIGHLLYEASEHQPPPYDSSSDNDDDGVDAGTNDDESTDSESSGASSDVAHRISSLSAHESSSRYGVDDTQAGVLADSATPFPATTAPSTAARRADRRRSRKEVALLARREAEFKKDVDESEAELGALAAAGIGNAARALRRRAERLREAELTSASSGFVVSEDNATASVPFAPFSASAAYGPSVLSNAEALSSSLETPILLVTTDSAKDGNKKPLPPLLPFGRGPHKLAVSLVRPSYSIEAHELYVRFNMALHRGRPRDSSESHYTRHLVRSPVQSVPAHWCGFLYRAATGKLAEGADAAEHPNPSNDTGDRRAQELRDAAMRPPPLPRVGTFWFPFTRLQTLSRLLCAPGLEPSTEASQLLQLIAKRHGSIAWLLASLSRLPAPGDDANLGASSVVPKEASSRSKLMWTDAEYRACAARGGSDGGTIDPPQWWQTPPVVPAAALHALANFDDACTSLNVSPLAYVFAVVVVARELLDAAETLVTTQAARISAIAARASTATSSGADFAAVESTSTSFFNASESMKRTQMATDSEDDASVAVPDPTGFNTRDFTPTDLQHAPLLPPSRDSSPHFSPSAAAGDSNACPSLEPTPEVDLPPNFASQKEFYSRIITICYSNHHRLVWLDEALQQHFDAIVERFDGSTTGTSAPAHVASEQAPVRDSARDNARRASAALFDRYVRPVSDTPSGYPDAQVSACQRSGSNGVDEEADGPRITLAGWDLSLGFGSFHAEYRLDGVLIAVSVLDILPTRVASVYFFYDTSLRYLELGKLSALLEIRLAQCIREHMRANPSTMCLPGDLPPPIIYWDPNFYVHTVPTMNYKRGFQPAEVQCPHLRFGAWVPLDNKALVKLDVDPGAPLGSVLCDDENGNLLADDTSAVVIAAASNAEVMELSEAEGIVDGTLHLIGGGQVYTFRELSDESRKLLRRGITRFMAKLGPLTAYRMKIDPLGIAGIESRWRAHEKRKVERKAERRAARAAREAVTHAVESTSNTSAEQPT